MKVSMKDLLELLKEAQSIADEIPEPFKKWVGEAYGRVAIKLLKIMDKDSATWRIIITGHVSEVFDMPDDWEPPWDMTVTKEEPVPEEPEIAASE